MLRALLAAVPAVSGACPSCVKPVHSWDTLPVSFHASEKVTNARGEFTAAELATIARFPLVTIEKWQGVGAVDSSGAPVFVWEEDAMVAAARQVKAARPDVSVIAWLDSTNVYTGWVFPPNLTACPNCSRDAAAHDELVNHTYNPDVFAVQGHSRAAEFLESRPELLLHNSTGAPALGWGNLHVYDHTQATVRDLWRDNCLALTASGAIDGCGADFSTNKAPQGVASDVAAAWEAGHAAMMREATAALGDGMLVGKNFEQLGDTVSAMLKEGCTPSNETVNGFRGLAARARATGRRYVAQCHFGHPQYVPPLNDSIAESCAAAFLCGAGEDHYFTTAGWWAKPDRFDHGNFSMHWLPSIMGRPLGAPLADATYDAATGVWSRSFATGTDVTFDARAGRGSIRWSDALPARRR